MKKMLLEYCKKIKSILQKTLTKNHFSLSLREWASMKNCWYVCLNVHFLKGQVQSLGVLIINRSMPAEKAFEMIIKKL